MQFTHYYLIYIFFMYAMFLLLLGILHMYGNKGHLDCVVQGYKSYIDL